MEFKFNIGDKIISIYEPNKIGIVVNIQTSYYPEPVYTIMYEDGNEYANYADSFRKVDD